MLMHEPSPVRDLFLLRAGAEHDLSMSANPGHELAPACRNELSQSSLMCERAHDLQDLRSWIQDLDPALRGSEHLMQEIAHA